MYSRATPENPELFAIKTTETHTASRKHKTVYRCKYSEEMRNERWNGAKDIFLVGNKCGYINCDSYGGLYSSRHTLLD